MSWHRRPPTPWIPSILINFFIIQGITNFGLLVVYSGLPPRKWITVQSEGPTINPPATNAGEQPLEWGSDLSLAPARYPIQESQGGGDSSSFRGPNVEVQTQGHDLTSRPSPRKRVGEPSGPANDEAAKIQKMVRECPDMFMPIRELSSSDKFQFIRSPQPSALPAGGLPAEIGVESNAIRLSPISAPASAPVSASVGAPVSAPTGRELNRISEPIDSPHPIPLETEPLETISEYYGFKKKHVEYSDEKNRHKNIFIADRKLGFLETKNLNLQGREKELMGDLELAADENPSIPVMEKKKSWFHSSALPTIEYTIRAALLRIRLLHHLYQPVLFETTEGLWNVQREALVFLSKFWQNRVIPRLFNPNNLIEPRSAGVVALEKKVTQELQRVDYLVEHQQTALSWIVFSYWLKEKVAPDHPVVYKNLVEPFLAPSDTQPVLDGSSMKASSSNSGRSSNSDAFTNTGYGTGTHQTSYSSSCDSYGSSIPTIKHRFKTYAADKALEEAGLGVKFKKQPVILRDEHSNTN